MYLKISSFRCVADEVEGFELIGIVVAEGDFLETLMPSSISDTFRSRSSFAHVCALASIASYSLSLFPACCE